MKRIHTYLYTCNPDEAPAWLTCGQTVLLFKKGDSKIAKNYRPITCLPTLYNLITLLLMNRVYEHVTALGILPLEQKGCCCRARGRKKVAGKGACRAPTRQWQPCAGCIPTAARRC